MEQVINIHNNGHEIDLKAGKYKIDVLGGWGVKLGQFSISFKNSVTGQIVDCERSFWPVQSFAFGKRAKRILTTRIVKSGTYKIEFWNPGTLEVKETNLFFSGLFQEPMPNGKISIYIH
jgi:hypothetical protein